MTDSGHDPAPWRRGRHPAAVLLLGSNCIVAQVVLLREFFSVLQGNELTIGIFLANWMVLTGMGALLGRLFRERLWNSSWLGILLLLQGTLPYCTVYCLYLLRVRLFPPGMMLGLIESFYGSLLLLLPLCLVSGMLFTRFAELISRMEGKNLISRVYALEAIGAIIGGTVLNVFLIFILPSFEILAVQAVVTVCVVVVFVKGRRVMLIRLGAVFCALFLIAITYMQDPGGTCRQILYPGEEVLHYEDTPYGNLTVTKRGEQVSVFENNTLLFSTDDVVASEEAVHYTMVQHPSPERVLIVSGIVSGMIPEILKYRVDHIDYIEVNPSIVSASVAYADFNAGNRARVIMDDGRRYLQNTESSYDVVLVNAPEPTTAQINRYFTIEFAAIVKERLTSDGVVCFSLPSSGEFLGRIAREQHSTLYNTIRSVFRHVEVIPGSRNYYIASDHAIATNIGELIDRAGIETRYVNSYYLDDILLTERSEEFRMLVERDAPLNRDFQSIGYRQQLSLWLSYFRNVPWIPVVGLFFVVLFGIVRLNAVSVGMFVAGWTGSSIEVLLLILFQIWYGSIYQYLGVLVTLFMAGLAVGSWYAGKRMRRYSISMLAAGELTMGALALGIAVFLALPAATRPDALTYGLLFAAVLVAGVLTGALFSVSTRILEGNVARVAARLYSVDLLGSAAGAMLVSVYMVPSYGMSATAGLLSLLCMLGCSVALLARGRYSIVYREASIHV